MNLRQVTIAGLIATIIFYSIVIACYASPPDNLWKGLIAEAVSENYEGMYAVCCVVRNRLSKGMNNGLVGLHRKDLDEFVRKHKAYEKMAKKIVYQVFECNGDDTTNGSLYFENISVFKYPDWARKKEFIKIIGNHAFWR